MLTLGLIILTVGLGLTYGPQAALYTELFPASIRFSGVSISYAIGAILGGAFAPDHRPGARAADGRHVRGHVVLGRDGRARTDQRRSSCATGVGFRWAPTTRPSKHESPIYGLSKV